VKRVAFWKTFVELVEEYMGFNEGKFRHYVSGRKVSDD